MRQLGLTALPLLILLNGCGPSPNSPSTSAETPTGADAAAGAATAAEPTKEAILFAYSATPGLAGVLSTRDKDGTLLDSLPFRAKSGDRNIPLDSIVKLTLTDPKGTGLWCDPFMDQQEQDSGLFPDHRKVSNAEIETKDDNKVKGCLSGEYNTLFVEPEKSDRDPVELTIYDPSLLWDANNKYHVRTAVGTFSRIDAAKR